MDSGIQDVLDTYHAMIETEHNSPRELPPGGRDGGQDQRLRAVGPETGQFINILARSLKAPTILELGTSFGYSGIWLAEAARASGGRLITMEMHDYKSAYARDMAVRAGLAEYVEFKVGDAVQMIGALSSGIDFVLVDLWKESLRSLPRSLLPQAQSGRDHRCRQHAAPGRR